MAEGAVETGDLASLLVGRRVVSLGADVVDIGRIRRITTENERFVQRVYTSGEQDYARAAKDPAERFAARFAAKEATLKALGVGLGGADFVDIEVSKRPSGEPILLVHGRAAQRANELGIASWLLTLSHADSVAYAVAVGLAAEPEYDNHG